MILADGRRLHNQSREEKGRWLKKKSRRSGDWPAKLLSDPADLGGILSDAQPSRHSCVSRLSKLEPSRLEREYLEAWALKAGRATRKRLYCPREWLCE